MQHFKVTYQIQGHTAEIVIEASNKYYAAEKVKQLLCIVDIEPIPKPEEVDVIRQMFNSNGMD